MTTFFLHMVRGLSMHELGCLLQCGKGLPGVYIYDHTTASALTPGPGVLAWPVEFLLAKHHRKFIFVPRRPPPLSDIGKALRNWDAKVRWNFIHTDEPRNDPHWKLRAKRKVTPSCDAVLPSTIESYLNECKHAILQQCHHTLSRWTQQSKRSNNFNTICRIGMNILRKGAWGVCPTDKDGGFVLIPKDCIVKLEDAILAGRHYVPTSLDPMRIAEVAHEYQQAAHSIAQVTQDPTLEQVLLSGYRSGDGSIRSILHMTMKTHKPDGEVVPRPIHASPRHPMAPGMRWLSLEFRKHLDYSPHILRDTSAFIQFVNTHILPANHVLIKFDIKDFFMSGEISDLISTCTKYFSSDMAPAGRQMLKAILHNQYIGVAGDKSTWRTVCGSGMGLICSGDISDLCFYDMCEKDFALTESVQSQYDISMYCRYKDDGFIGIGGTRQSRLQFLSELRRRSRFFKIVVDSIHFNEAKMLDLVVFKGSRWQITGLLDFCSYTKPSSQGMPLATNSGHPNHVHRNWPLAQLHRLERNCSNKRDAVHFKTSFCNLLRATTGVQLSPDHHTSVVGRSLHSGGPRLILPFKPVWGKAGVPRILFDIWEKWKNRFHQEGVSLHASQVAWKLGHPHLAKLLKRCNAEWHDNRDLFKAVFLT